MISHPTDMPIARVSSNVCEQSDVLSTQPNNSILSAGFVVAVVDIVVVVFVVAVVSVAVFVFVVGDVVVVEDCKEKLNM